MAKRKKPPGHYCWVCRRQRPNERFSGKGHARHVCRDCAKLGKKELAYRQNVRDLERCLNLDGFIRRKQRATFLRFLRHEDRRVRAMAEELQRRDAENRALFRELREAEEAAEEVYFEQWTGDESPF